MIKDNIKQKLLEALEKDIAMLQYEHDNDGLTFDDLFLFGELYFDNLRVVIDNIEEE